MRSSLQSLLVVLTIAIALPSDQARALEVFGNITASGGASELGSAGNPIGTGGAQYNKFAQGFTVGSTNQVMTDVVLGLQFGAQLPSSVRVSLYQSSGNNATTSNPTTEIGVFTNPTFTANTKNIYTFNYAGNFTLQANTSYWIVASFNTPLTGSYDWAYNAANTAPAAQNSSGFLPMNARSTTNTAPNTWILENTSPYNRASITVVVVPEPSTYALGIAGTLVMATIARRRNRKTALA